jgi:hypothetical protein
MFSLSESDIENQVMPKPKIGVSRIVWETAGGILRRHEEIKTHPLLQTLLDENIKFLIALW